MITDALDTIVSIIGAFVSALGSLYVVPGVSLLGFLIAVNMVIILIGAIILRA